MLCRNYQCLSWDSQQVMDVLKKMTPDNAYYLLVSKEQQCSAAPEGELVWSSDQKRTEKWYKTEFYGPLKVETTTDDLVFSEKKYDIGYCPHNPFIRSKTKMPT